MQRIRRILLHGTLGLTAIALMAGISIDSHAITLNLCQPIGGEAKVLVFDQATVVDVESGERRPNQRVMIVDRCIDTIGDSDAIQIPPGAHVVDARGKYLIPGLWNMHVHLFGRPNVMYRWMVANGITGMREAASEIPLDSFRHWKQEIAAGIRVGPRQVVSGRALNECRLPTLPHWICVSSSTAARHIVDSFKTAGADLIKTYHLSIPMYFTVAAESRRIGIPFGGHLPRTLDGLEASDSGARILDHQTYFHPDICGDFGDTADLDRVRCTAAAQRLRHNDTWVADAEWLGFKNPPAESIYVRWQRYASMPLSRTERDDLPSGTAWGSLFDDRHCRAAAVKQAANLPMLANTDWGHPGLGIHLYLLMKVVCGMSPLQALQTATINPVRALHLTDSLGTVATGKLADMVLLEGDPLTDIWNASKVHAVVVNGYYFDRAKLDRLLIEAKAEPPS